MALIRKSSTQKEQDEMMEEVIGQDSGFPSDSRLYDEKYFSGADGLDSSKYPEENRQNGLQEAVFDEKEEIKEEEHKRLEEDSQESRKLEEIGQMIQEGFEEFQKRLVILENKVEAIGQEKEKDGNNEFLSDLSRQIEAVVKNQDRNDRQIAQTLRENANFQIQVRQGMQKELDAYKKIDSKEVFVPVLESLASVYIEYQTIFKKKIENLSEKDLDSVPDGTEEIKNKLESIYKDMKEIEKSLNFILDDLKEILEDNGAEIVKSKVGEKRKARLCKIMRKIPTADVEKHNTIAESVREGVILGRQILCNEYVDVYVYDENLPKEDNILEDDKIQNREVEVEQEISGNVERNSGEEIKNAEDSCGNKEGLIDGDLWN